jgi:transposase
MSNNTERVEVFSGIQRRRRYSVDQKLAVLAEAAQPGMSISYVARRHGISPTEVRALEKRVRELERVLGKKTLENEILREALKLAQEKKLISHLPSLPEGDTP